MIDKLIPIAAVCEQSGLCRAAVYEKAKAGAFPKQVHIGASARWSQQEVQDWIEARKAEREPVAEVRA